MSAVRLVDVGKVRGAGRHAVQALRAVTLAIEPGEFVLLEGPSGAGKTTLLSVSAGLLTPDEGDVTLAGRSLLKLSAAERRAHRARNVGFVFQRGNLLDGLSVRENVLVAAEIAGIPRQVGEEDAAHLLAVLGVDHLAERRPDALSGGEEHRVAVARALVHRPAVVFADEPTGNLDGASGQAVAEALSELAKADAVAVIVATHDERLRRFADRRLSIVDGVVHPTE
ncbi:MAG: ABC transporter ATP-binding protein [Gemmatimonadota bacterium]|nr:MAG: ABC transporter ATP-binding protein [Gemmatimonadota bacterium]